MFKKIADFNSKIITIGVILCLSGMFFLVVLQVILRFMKTGFGWNEEVARYLMIWAAFLGGTLAFRQGSHVGMDIIANRLKGNKARIVNIINLFLVIIFLFILGKESYLLILKLRQLTPALRIPYKYIYSIIPISCILMIIQALSDLQSLLIDNHNDFNVSKGGSIEC